MIHIYTLICVYSDNSLRPKVRVGQNRSFQSYLELLVILIVSGVGICCKIHLVNNFIKNFLWKMLQFLAVPL